jgi:hypothetical protein
LPFSVDTRRERACSASYYPLLSTELTFRRIPAFLSEMPLLTAVLLLPLTCGPFATAPRYVLRAGERIDYRRSVTLDTDNAIPFEETIQLYVLESTPVDAHLLAIRIRDGAPTGALQFRVSDRGHFTLPEETRNRADSANDLFELFPSLAPALDNQDAWIGQPDLFGCVLRQRRTAADASSLQIRFTVDDPTGVSGFVGDRAEGVYWIDTAAGLMTRWEMTRINPRQNRRATIRCDLVGRESVGSAWLDKRRAELERFIRTQRIEDGLLEEVETQPARVEGTIRRIEHTWGEYLAQPPRDPDSPLRRVAEVCEHRSAALAPGLRERAALAAQWLGAPAAHWSLQNTAGETITSESVRKGVTVECFWSAASTPSLRMFSVLEGLRDERLPDPPSIVFINLDSDVVAARRAAAACARDLLSVFSGPPMEGEMPATLPIVRILDASGRVRRVHVGWCTSLVQTVKDVAAGKREPPRP